MLEKGLKSESRTVVMERNMASTMGSGDMPVFATPAMVALMENAAMNAVAAELGDTGRVLVRESGTEPVLRVMVEAPEDAICRQCVDRVVDVIRRNGHCV